MKVHPKGSASGQSSASLIVGLFLASALVVCGYGVAKYLPAAPDVSADRLSSRVVKSGGEEKAPFIQSVHEAVQEAKRSCTVPSVLNGRNYEKEARQAFIYADKKGLVDRASLICAEMGFNVSTALTLAKFESHMGKFEQVDFVKDEKDQTSAIGTFQITEGSFLEMLGLYGKDAVKTLKKVYSDCPDPDAEKIRQVDRLGYLLGFLTLDPQTNKVTLDSARFNKAHKTKGNALLTAFLKLRTGEFGEDLSLFSAIRDFQKKSPVLESKIKENTPEHVQELVAEYGDGFYFRLVHNWGLDGAVKLLTCQDSDVPMADLVGDKTAQRNGWKEWSVGDMLHQTAASFHKVEQTFTQLCPSPDPAGKGKQVAQKKWAPAAG